ncbi:MAG: tRNA uridine-5-carboxymethylaminomethyl(34) synthesis GTPase MnmE [Clostridia bacterium]|nr:tRNA uridine-5-carboxymethylaminomethyl(34) synthesis GTPase MnmE [Clostridia bacterium]
MKDEIAAISTAAGTGGVAIIRISGSNPLSIAEKMFKPSGSTSVKNFTPNFMYTGKISGEGFEDFGMCVYFKAPKSFTGENVVEFHCHGGVQIARGILAKALSLGATAAEKGEFTKRAFINGKLSLSSAEGMIDMINAESLALVRAGSMLYNEKLTEKIKELQAELQLILAEIAADIDYPEEDLESLNEGKISAKIKSLSKKLNDLASSYSCGKMIKDGVTVAICGKPNTGKSSLLNALLGYDKAIVSSEAGTTRDAVEGSIEIGGVKYNLIDTAGIRESAGAVESIGIERAKKILSSADIVLSVTDGDGKAEQFNTQGTVIKVYNKCDIAAPKENYDAIISAKTGEGLENLKKLLSEKAVGEMSLDKAYIIEKRHYTALIKANEALLSALENIGSFTVDILAIDLKEAWDALGEITGETANEQIINTVFEKFCVGK